MKRVFNLYACVFNEVFKRLMKHQALRLNESLKIRIKLFFHVDKTTKEHKKVYQMVA